MFALLWNAVQNQTRAESWPFTFLNQFFPLKLHLFRTQQMVDDFFVHFWQVIRLSKDSQLSIKTVSRLSKFLFIRHLLLRPSLVGLQKLCIIMIDKDLANAESWNLWRLQSWRAHFYYFLLITTAIKSDMSAIFQKHKKRMLACYWLITWKPWSYLKLCH